MSSYSILLAAVVSHSLLAHLLNPPSYPIMSSQRFREAIGMLCKCYCPRKGFFRKSKNCHYQRRETGHKTIDEKMLIDTHYGAIANRAVKQKPAELIVPEKGQQGFKKLFGISWVDAVKQGMVYNAKDACVKLSVDGLVCCANPQRIYIKIH